MRKKELEKLIAKEIADSTPHKAHRITGETKQEKQKNVFKLNRRFAMALVSFVLIICVSLGVVIKNLSSKNSEFVIASEGTIVLDINPSIEVKYDKNGKVTSVIGLNADGKILELNNVYVGKDYVSFVNELVSDCQELGYFSTQKQNNAILITVLDKDGNNYKEFSNQLNNQFQKTFNNKNLKGVVISDHDLKGEAKQGLTIQKTSLVDKIVELSKQTKHELRFEDIKDSSISDLYVLKEEMQIKVLVNQIITQLPQLSNGLLTNKMQISLILSNSIGISWQEAELLVDLFCNSLTNIINFINKESNEYEDDFEDYLEDANELFVLVLNNNLFKNIVNNSEISQILQESLASVSVNEIYNNLYQFFSYWKTDNCPQEVLENRKGKNQNKPNNLPPNNSGKDDFNDKPNNNHPPKEEDFKHGWFDKCDEWDFDDDWEEEKDFFM